MKTRKEGLELLAKYHADPNAVTSDTTFEQVYEMLFKKRESQISDSTKRTYVAAIVRKLVGHSGHGVTEQVYLHVELPQLLEAVNKLK